ncbi:CAP domain-containing protein [Crocinitomix algicola]|uniref:CAP domain-containing protein n=1 Tax=Crocinitomix algicola TaxID=1740263 RepID=UPI00087209DE|nr:CAP domain-containing protein [Crocinitomix algicola]
MKKILFIWLLIPVLSYGQNEKVDLKSFNEELLAEYLRAEVNKFRARKRLDTLVNDEILAKAAKDQANYMADKQQIGHGQKSKLKGSPYKRVLYYGGSHNAVGENVMAFDLARAVKKSKNRLTYERLAKDMVKDWSKSRGHKENLLEAKYANIAHEFRLQDGTLFTCQVFGSKPFVEQYEFIKGGNLSVKEGGECLNCKQVKEKIYNDEVSLGWYSVSNDSIFYWNTNYYRKGRFYRKKKEKYLFNAKKNNLNKVFKANGQLTFDVLHHEQFDCGGKPSFHNSLYHNGYYIGYLTKREVLMNDIHPSPNLVKVFIGTKPAFADSFFQVDFHLMKRQKQCMQTSTVFVTPDHFKPKEYFQLPKASLSENKVLTIVDSVVTQISFERNQTDEDTSIFRPLITIMDSLVRDKHQIEQIFFTGVASIEGNLKSNRKLILRRGGIIENYLKRYYPEILFENKFYENFDDFKSGLVAAGYVDATEISNDTLRMFANDNKDDKEIAKILDQSRYSTVKIVFKDEYKVEEGFYGLSVERINDLIAENRVNEAAPLYLILANRAINGVSDSGEELLKISFPEEEKFQKLIYYQFVLGLHLNQKTVISEDLNRLKKVGAIKSDAMYLEYALLFNLFNQNNNIKYGNKQAILANERAKRQVGWIECLHMIHAVENFQSKPEQVIDSIMEFVIDLKFDLKPTYLICQYLIDWGYTAEPYVLLSKFARRSGEFPKLYKQYLKLGYFLQQFEVEKEWKKIKNVIKNLAEDYPEEFCMLFKWNEMGVGGLAKQEIAELFCQNCAEK